MTTVTAAPENIMERWLALFDRRWPTPDEVRAALTPDVRFVERLERRAGRGRRVVDGRHRPAGLVRRPLHAAQRAHRPHPAARLLRAVTA